MSFNVSFHPELMSTNSLKNIADFVKTNKEVSEDSRVKNSVNGLVETGKNSRGLFGRSQPDKAANDAMRTQFVNALTKELGIEGSFNECLDRLETLLGDNIFKKGDYGKGRPLTMRRIAAVLNRADELKSREMYQQMNALDTTRASLRIDYADAFSRIAESLAGNGEGKIDPHVKMLLTKEVDRALSNLNMSLECNTIDLTRCCYEAIRKHSQDRHLSFHRAPAFQQAQEMAANILAADKSGILTKTAAELKANRDNYLTLYINCPNSAFTKFSREDVQSVAKFIGKAIGCDYNTAERLAFINMQIRHSIKNVGSEGVRLSDPVKQKNVEIEIMVNSLRNFGVTDDVAKELWGVDNLSDPVKVHVARPETIAPSGKLEKPTAASLKDAAPGQVIGEIRKILEAFRDVYRDDRGNVNNELFKGGVQKSKYRTIVDTLNKLDNLLKDDTHKKISAKLEAVVANDETRTNPCDDSEEGKAATTLLEAAMGNIGAHGNKQTAGEINEALKAFMKIPELFVKCLEKDEADGNDKHLQDFMTALNTDGCVQGYSRAIYDLNTELEDIVKADDHDYDPKAPIYSHFDDAFKTLFPNNNEQNPVKFDDAMKAIAKFLGAKPGFAPEAELLAGFTAEKPTILNYVLTDRVVE